MFRARENPFCADRIQSVKYRLDERGWENLLNDLSQHDFRASIVGPEGSGKTALLRDLALQLEDMGFAPVVVGFRRESDGVNSFFSYSRAQLDFVEAGEVEADAVFLPGRAKVGLNTVFLLDGAEQLGALAWMKWKRLSQRAAGLVITLHKSSRLPTVFECKTTPPLLRSIIEEILGEQVDEFDRLVVPLFEKHQGNLREALRECYDIYASNRSSEPEQFVFQRAVSQ